MSGLKINYKLQDLNHVMLWGEKPHRNIHWFGLTDGLLWIDVGEFIPEELYSDLDEFVDKSHAWKALHDDGGDEQVKAAVEKEWDGVELEKNV